MSISQLDWICPLLAIDADAFNHGGTPEFATISAVVQRHNAAIEAVTALGLEALRGSHTRPVREHTPQISVHARRAGGRAYRPIS